MATNNNVEDGRNIQKIPHGFAVPTFHLDIRNPSAVVWLKHGRVLDPLNGEADKIDELGLSAKSRLCVVLERAHFQVVFADRSGRTSLSRPSTVAKNEFDLIVELPRVVTFRPRCLYSAGAALDAAFRDLFDYL